MGDVVYRSVVELTERKGVDRTVVLPVGEEVRFGSHGAVAEHYGRVAGEYEPRSTTLDHVVAAAVG
jgi:hypothetical protein